VSTNLSKEAASLVQAGRTALRPSQVDKVSVRRALEQHFALQSVAPLGESAVTKTAAIWPKALGVAAVIGASTIGAVLLWPSDHDQSLEFTFEAKSPSNAPLLSDPSMTLEVGFAAPQPSQTAPLQPSTTEARSEPTSVDSSRSRSDRLREEVALLTRAQKEFQANRLSTALSLTDEHRRKFSRGALIQERVKLRVRVLCAMGRVKEADAEQARLARPQTGEAELAPSNACSVQR
jgi:hypothetical protein